MTDIKEVPAPGTGEDFEQGMPQTDSHGEAELNADVRGGQVLVIPFRPVPYDEQPPTLVIFETARRQIAEATTTDEVKRVLAMATGLAAAARAATDSEMEAEAQVLKLEAERKLGKLMQSQGETVGFNTGTAGQGRPTLGGIPENPPKNDERPTLAEAAIDKNLAHRARTAATMTEVEFAAAKEATRQRVRTPRTRHTKPKEPPREVVDECVDKVRSLIDVTLKALKSTNASRADFERLFAALNDTLSDLESTTLTPEDEGVDDAEVPVPAPPEALDIPGFLRR